MDHEKRIIRYLDGEMQAEEIRQFEQEMKTDQDFARQVEEIRKLQNLARKAFESERDPEAGLKKEIRKEIRTSVQDFKEKGSVKTGLPDTYLDRLKAAERNYFQKPDGKLKQLRVLWYSLAAVIVIGGILSVLLLRPFARPEPADLYAAYFEPLDKATGIAEITRSNDNFLFAVEVYESGDYERASVLFHMLADSAVAGDYALLYLGHSYMSLNRTSEAIAVFEELIQDGNPDLVKDAEWYLSLCYLKSGKLENALEMLEQIRASDSPHKAKAGKILRSLR